MFDSVFLGISQWTEFNTLYWAWLGVGIAVFSYRAFYLNVADLFPPISTLMWCSIAIFFAHYTTNVGPFVHLLLYWPVIIIIVTLAMWHEDYRTRHPS